MKKLVIFDLDGTLIDSVPDILDSINAMLERFHFPLVSRERILAGIGQGGEGFVRSCLPEGAKDRVAECRPVYNEIYRSCGSKKTRVMEGIRAVLCALKERGVKLAILTNKPQQNTEAIYALKLAEFGFDVVFGSREGRPLKPDPRVIDEVLAATGATKEEAVIVGDGEPDMRAAKASGVASIAVGWGYRPLSVLKENGADRAVNTPAELLELLLAE